MNSTVSSRNVQCATCALWAGSRDTQPPYPSSIVIYEVYSEGKCLGGGFNSCNTPPIGTCGSWEKWSVLK